ncbi:VOC family protein [Nocardia vaccinii]|uniref:VOC family protein n=1 Tax=Nocardia vaccinii TaxID=1822 RepID=UPI00082E81A9|nr:VOC family protein [Nocardia vaccinii]
MINGAHTIVYAADPDAARDFFRDVLGLAHVDAGHGWLIFRSPPAELAVHPADEPDSGRCELYLMCDDLAATVEELRARGVEFAGDITRERWGLRTTLIVPGAGPLGLYQPTHEIAYEIE